MFRATLRSTARATRSATSTTTLTPTSRRYLSFGPPDKPRTWKGAAVRWGLAFSALYWYNTSPIFADEPLRMSTPNPLPLRSAEASPPEPCANRLGLFMMWLFYTRVY